MDDDKILNYFSLLKKRKILGKAYLFIGDNFSLVKNVAKLINCDNDEEHFCDICLTCKKIEELSHPDLFIVAPKTLSITIDSIRECQEFLRLKSFCAKRKIVIIKQAENIGEAAASAFLKTLEEPPKNSLIFICTSKLEGVLPTIVSRCRKIFLPFKEAELDEACIKYVCDFLKGERFEFKDRKDFKNFLWAFIVVLRDYMVLAHSHKNNKLLARDSYEIILPLLQKRKGYAPNKQSELLAELLSVYSVYNTVNENLALNLIRTKL